MVVAYDEIEIYKPDERPHGQEYVRLRFERIVAKGAREKQEYRKGEQDGQTDSADYSVSLDAFPSRNLEYGYGHGAVDDGCANRGGVHDPSDSRSSEEGYGQGYEQYQKDGVDGNLLVIELGKALGQDAILRHGVAQTAYGTQHADEAGKHQRGQGRHQNIDSGLAKVVLCRKEGRQSGDSLEFVQAANVVEPARAALRIGRDA